MDEGVINDLTCPSEVGLCIPLFYYLWLKNNKRLKGKKIAALALSNDDDMLKINIPDTIIYNFQKPQNWYFTSRAPELAGTIRRKKRINMSSQRIIEQFLPPRSQSGIAAVLVSLEPTHGQGHLPSPYDHSDVPSASPHTHSEPTNTSTPTPTADAEARLDATPVPGSLRAKHTFLSETALRLHVERSQVQTGILQTFIDPQPGPDGATRATTIVANWQPGAAARRSFEIWENRLRLPQRPGGLSDAEMQRRGVTVTGTYDLVRVVPLLSRTLQAELCRICECVAAHLRRVADVVVTSMTLNFVVDRRHTIWMTHCSSLRVVPDLARPTHAPNSSNTHTLLRHSSQVFTLEHEGEPGGLGISTSDGRPSHPATDSPRPAPRGATGPDAGSPVPLGEAHSERHRGGARGTLRSVSPAPRSRRLPGASPPPPGPSPAFLRMLQARRHAALQTLRHLDHTSSRGRCPTPGRSCEADPLAVFRAWRNERPDTHHRRPTPEPPHPGLDPFLVQFFTRGTLKRIVAALEGPSTIGGPSETQRPPFCPIGPPRNIERKPHKQPRRLRPLVTRPDPPPAPHADTQTEWRPYTALTDAPTPPTPQSELPVEEWDVAALPQSAVRHRLLR